MNKFLFRFGLLATAIVAVPAKAEQPVFAKDQLVLHLQQVSTLIQSSKIQYKDWYLFVAKVDSARIALADGASAGQLEELIPSGQTVEIMLHKDNCYEEIQAAFVTGSANVVMTYVKQAYFIATPDDPHHDFFLKVEPLVTADRDRAECIVKHPRN